MALQIDTEGRSDGVWCRARGVNECNRDFSSTTRQFDLFSANRSGEKGQRINTALAVSYSYDGPVACTTLFGETPTPAGAEQDALTLFLNPDLMGGTFVRLHAIFPSEEFTTIT